MNKEITKEQKKLLAEVLVEGLEFFDGRKNEAIDYLAGFQEDMPEKYRFVIRYKNDESVHAIHPFKKAESIITEQKMDYKILTDMRKRLILMLYHTNNMYLPEYMILDEKRYFHYKEAGILNDIYNWDMVVVSDYLENASHSTSYNARKIIKLVLTNMIQELPDIVQNKLDKFEISTEYSKHGWRSETLLPIYLFVLCKKTDELEEILPFMIQWMKKSKSDDLLPILNFLLNDAYQFSKKINTFMREILTEMYDGYFWYFEQPTFLELCKQYKDVPKPEIRYYLRNFVYADNTSKSQEAFSKLEYYLDKKKEICFSLMDDMLTKQDDLVLTLYALLRFKYKESAKYKTQIYEIIKNYSKTNEILQLYTENEKQIFFREGEKYNQKMIKPLLYMIDDEECIEIRKLITSVLSYFYYYSNEAEIFSLFENSVFLNHKEDAFEYLYQYIPFPAICAVALLEKRTTQLLVFLKAHKKEAENVISSASLDEYRMKAYLELMYKEDSGFDVNVLIDAFINLECMEEIKQLLVPYGDKARNRVYKEMKSKNKERAYAAFYLICLWDHNQLKENLSSGKVENFSSSFFDLYTKQHQKYVPFTKEIDYGKVHLKDSEQYLPDYMMKLFVAEYMIPKEEPERVAICEMIFEAANQKDIRDLLNLIFDTWLLKKSTPKYANLIILSAFYLTDAQLWNKKTQLDDWAVIKKRPLSNYFLKCVAVNGRKMGLFMVRSTYELNSDNLLKEAAREVLVYARNRMGITKNEFEDLLIPSFGFGKDRKRTFTYGGEREFIVVLTLNHKLELYSNEKMITMLPKYSKKYHETEQLELEVKEELSWMKKHLKMIIESQKKRLQRAVYLEETWTRQRWEDLFIKNPVMTIFANKLIWIEYNEKNELVGVFRYLEDGTFCTEKEEIYELQETSRIRLLHPDDVRFEDKELVKNFTEQLLDYEIEQPIEQLALPYTEDMSEIENAVELIEFKDKKVYAGNVKKVAEKIDAYKISSEFLYEHYVGKRLVRDWLKTSVYICNLTEEVQLEAEIYGESRSYDSLLRIISINFKDKNRKKIPLCQLPKKSISFGKKVGEMLCVKE